MKYVDCSWYWSPEDCYTEKSVNRKRIVNWYSDIKSCENKKLEIKLVCEKGCMADVCIISIFSWNKNCVIKSNITCSESLHPYIAPNICLYILGVKLCIHSLEMITWHVAWVPFCSTVCQCIEARSKSLTFCRHHFRCNLLNENDCVVIYISSVLVRVQLKNKCIGSVNELMLERWQAIFWT